MNLSQFVTVGENIHCTRIVKRGGSRTETSSDGVESVIFRYKGERYLLPVPPNWADVSPAYEEGKIHHVALAIHLALEGKSEEERNVAGLYLQWAAQRQIDKRANFLDVNVDEFTNDTQKRIEVMKWLVEYLSAHFEFPLSIDSSNVATLDAGLSVTRKDTASMVNSVSLEREEAVDIVISHGAESIVSAAGKTGLPSSVDERLSNFEKIIGILSGKGMAVSKMHLDPLVFPISVDPGNGKSFFEATSRARSAYPEANITGGLSNISFGMPNRKLLNMVFTWLFVQSGGNGGIIDPTQTSPAEIEALDPESESFTLARAVLEGTDMFGGEYIAAHREGRLA